MNNRYGWICPQCGRVWAPYITKCGPCEAVATGGHGITHNWSPNIEDEDDYCTCYHDGECWGTKERETTGCGGKSNKCDKYDSDWR